VKERGKRANKRKKNEKVRDEGEEKDRMRQKGMNRCAYVCMYV